MIEKPKKSALLDRSPKRRFDSPLRYLTAKPPQCTYCSCRALVRCEFPGCQLVMCNRCRIRKFGGTLCRTHEDAMLLQAEGEASPQFEAIDGDVGRFSARGDAVPHE